jgi:hyaluronan synthase
MLGYILTSISLIYIIYIYSLWISREGEVFKEFNKPFTVIIPCYNEGKKELIECVESCIKADGNSQIILVNNNSNKEETRLAILELITTYPKLEVYQEARQGKRFAHSKGLEYAKNDLIIFVDSDTIVNKDAFTELIKPFQDEKIGAVAGQVCIKNKKDNILTKSLSAMFWTSNNIFRKATSSLGFMGVIAGALGAYRKELLIKLEPDYLSQTFLGRPCSISDDRFLTMRIQTRFKMKIDYLESAKGFTYMPTNIKKTWKMMERWRRGVLREVILLWKEPFWNAKLLMFDVQFNFIVLCLMIIVKGFFIYNLIADFSLIGLVYTIFWFIITATLYSSIMLVENPKEFPYKLTWSILYEFIFVFTFIHALIKIRNQGAWNTR